MQRHWGFACPPMTVTSLYQPHNKSLTHCVCMLQSSCSVCLCSCWRWKVSSSLKKANLHSPPLPKCSSHTGPCSQEETEATEASQHTLRRPQYSDTQNSWQGCKHFIMRFDIYMISVYHECDCNHTGHCKLSCLTLTKGHTGRRLQHSFGCREW